MSKGKRYSRGHAVRVAERVQEVMSLALVDDSDYEICGSWRRNCETLGDLDVVVRKSVIGRLRNAIVALAASKSWLGQKDIYRRKYDQEITGFNTLGMNVELYVSDDEGWGAALMYTTGSPQFNIGTRALAKRMGLLLNEKGLFHRSSGEKVCCAETERAIFEALGLDWKEPEERERWQW